MHRVKGLEYPYVFIVGVNDGIVPLLWYVQGLDDVAQAEAVLQERCLLHVAATRAREGLYVTSWGIPSRFLQGGHGDEARRPPPPKQLNS